MDELTAQEEIAFIKKVMQDSRKVIYSDGKDFIYWGILVTICLLHTYFSIIFRSGNPTARIYWVWTIIMALGVFGSIFFFRKRINCPEQKTLAGQILGKIWLANGIGMIMVGFVGGFSGAIHGLFISPLMSSFLGASYFISGFIYGKKWITNLSFLWWLGAAIMFIFPGVYSILLMAGMMISFQIIPGIILYRKSKLEFAKTE